jgi:transposase InsO family protein
MDAEARDQSARRHLTQLARLQIRNEPFQGARPLKTRIAEAHEVSDDRQRHSFIRCRSIRRVEIAQPRPACRAGFDGEACDGARRRGDNRRVENAEAVEQGISRRRRDVLDCSIDGGSDGVELATVAKYMARRRTPPSQGWKTFLRNHADGIASMDLFLVPTISFRLLYGFLILQHTRRKLLWLGVTAHPSAEWLAHQLTEAYGWQRTPQYIIRDRDRAYGHAFLRRLRAMGIRDRPITPRSPWQNGCAERLIGSIRRDCLDHVLVFGERHLRHLLKSYQEYYNEARTHLSVQKDAPVSRAVQAVGQTFAVPILGGLHHQYIRA